MRRMIVPVIGFLLLCYGCAKEMPGVNDTGPAAFLQVAQAVPAKADAVPVPKNRKIIYIADVALVTDDLDDFRTRLNSALETLQGFVSAEQLTGRTGLQRTGIWTVRIPAEKFDSFLEQLATWGELESQQIKSDDVTEEFVDVESRLKNKRIEEQRLLEILEKKTGELEQVVALEQAISGVREQIERMEGRLRYLTEKIDLTTITITVREIENYVPPQPPTLSTEIARTFHGSVRNLKDSGKQLLLILVAVVPWLIPLSIVLIPITLIIRRLQHHAIPFAEEVKRPKNS